MSNLTVSIVHYDTPIARLTATLTSLLDAIGNAREAGLLLSAEVALVINGGSPQPQQLAQWAARAEAQGVGWRVVVGHGNVGYGRGNNCALLLARSQFHLILNPDVTLHPESLSAGLRYLAQQPGCVMVTPQAVDAHGEPTSLIKREPTLAALLLRGFAPAALRRACRGILDHYEYRDLDRQAAARGVAIASGAFMLCRNDALQAIGGFDPRYFLYFEDFDLSHRIGRLGRIDYVPAVRIVHEGGGAARKGVRHVWWFARSAVRYFALRLVRG